MANTSETVTRAVLEAILQRLQQPTTPMEHTADRRRSDAPTLDNMPPVDQSQISNEQALAAVGISLGHSVDQSTFLTAAANSASHIPAINIFNVTNLNVHVPSPSNSTPTVLNGAEYSEKTAPTPAPTTSKISLCKQIFKRKRVEKDAQEEHPYVQKVQVRDKGQALQPKNMLFDTGADIDIISYQDVQDLGLENQINKTSDVPDFRQWNGETVELVGTIKLAWSFPKHKNQRETLFNVAAPGYTNINVIVLGAKSIHKDEPLKARVFMGGCTRTLFHPKPAREFGVDSDPKKQAALAKFNHDFNENKRLKEEQKRIAEQRSRLQAV